MSIRIDYEADYAYRTTLTAIHMLKAFYDAGVDVKKHAEYYSLHMTGRYGYSDSDLITLFYYLAPHVLSDCTFLEGYVSHETNEAKHEILSGMNIIEDKDRKLLLSNSKKLYTFSLFHYKGDFSGVDFAEAQKAAYPYLNKYQHCLDEAHKESYFKYTQMPKGTNYIEEEDGIPIYYYLNFDKTEFVLLFDTDLYCSNLICTADLLSNIHAQVQRNA